MNQVKVSKFLSFILRHQPHAIGLELDENGWANIDELIECAQRDGRNITKELILDAVANNNKQRFSISDDGTLIRARQGHSLTAIDLQLEPSAPPDTLFHGTAGRFIDSIMAKGLEPGSRQHVHLSLDIATAMEVGRRHGKPVVLKVDSGSMYNNNFSFYLSENGVWLTKIVPVEYLELITAS